MLQTLILVTLAAAGPCPYADLVKRAAPNNDGVSAEAQLANNWNKVITSPSQSSSYTYSPLALLFQSMSPSVSEKGDVLPSGRDKRVHSAGAVSKARFEVLPNPYTGVFNVSTSNALLRYSLAAEPNGKDNIIAAGALKFFRDNIPSANTFFMTGIDGQTDLNFLSQDLSNHLSSKQGGIKGQILARKFATAPTNWAVFTGTSDLASFDYKGNAVAKPIYPFQLLFRPSAEAQNAVSNGLQKTTANDNYRSLKALVAIPKGTLLWTVYASPSPNGKFSKIANVYADSETVLNAYGNDGLFFKHQVWDEDVKDGSIGAPWKTTCPDVNSCVTCHSSNTCHGLDNAGKTTIVKKLLLQDTSTISPTLGFNIETIFYKDYKLNIWDVGGQSSIRSYWKNYFEETDALIFVIDSVDRDRLLLCKKELLSLLQQERLLGTTLLIFANKQDMDGALGLEEIKKVLGLSDIKNHWNIVSCSAYTGQGLIEGIDWLVADVSSRLFTFE